MAEKSNALKIKEILIQKNNFLFKVERLAIFLVIILPKFTCFSFIYFILTSFLSIEVFLHRGLGTASSPPNFHHVLFFLERAGSILLVLYYWATNYWYIAVGSLVISTTCVACTLSFVPWQNFQKNGIPCPNPREIRFLLERLAAIVFIFYPGSASLFADFFCFSGIIYLICLALRLGVNPRRNEHDYLFWIERAATIILKYHCTNRTIFIARVIFVVTNSAYFADSLEPKQGQQMQGIISPVSTTQTPKFREIDKVEQSERQKAKIEDDPPKEKLDVNQAASKEENIKWEEDLAEADNQLKEEAEIEEAASKEEDRKWEEDLVEQKSGIQEETPKEEHSKWEEELVEVDDSWEEEMVEADEGIEEIERLKAENDHLKREKEILSQRLERVSGEYEQDYENMLKKMQDEWEETFFKNKLSR